MWNRGVNQPMQGSSSQLQKPMQWNQPPQLPQNYGTSYGNSSMSTPVGLPQLGMQQPNMGMRSPMPMQPAQQMGGYGQGRMNNIGAYQRWLQERKRKQYMMQGGGFGVTTQPVNPMMYNTQPRY